MLNLKNKEKFYDAVLDDICKKKANNKNKLKKWKVFFWTKNPGWKICITQNENFLKKQIFLK